MAKELNIKRCWFHKTHYDITKLRISEITNKCNVVSSKEIVNIIKEDQSQIKIDMEFETIRKPSKAFHKIIQAPLCKNKTKGSKKP